MVLEAYRQRLVSLKVSDLFTLYCRMLLLPEDTGSKHLGDACVQGHHPEYKYTRRCVDSPRVSHIPVYTYIYTYIHKHTCRYAGASTHIYCVELLTCRRGTHVQNMYVRTYIHAYIPTHQHTYIHTVHNIT